MLCVDFRHLFSRTDWSPEYGGVVSYIAKDADEEVTIAMSCCGDFKQ